MVHSGLIPSRVKPKTYKIGIHFIPARHSAVKKDSVKTSSHVAGRLADDDLIQDQKIPSFLHQSNALNKDVIVITCASCKPFKYLASKFWRKDFPVLNGPDIA